MTYVIDHRDSFTWNIVHLLEKHSIVQVVDYTQLDSVAIPQDALVVLSPGPGSPADYPGTLAWLARVSDEQPLLGICLGFQMMLYLVGARVVRQERVMHGVQTPLEIEPSSLLYTGVEEPVLVGRYHALRVAMPEVIVGYRVSAWDVSSHIPLSIEHLTLPRFGVQYHPDSFLTPNGDLIIANVYRELGRWT